MHPLAELLLKLAIAAVVAVLVGLLDGLFDIATPWWLCALIGLVVVFGGVLIIQHSDDW